MIEQLCPKCSKWKNETQFSKSSSRKNGLNGWCKECIKSISARYLPHKRQQSREARAALRLEVLTHYSSGAPCCACCGEQTMEFLSIDHIKGGGVKHKRLVKHIYRWLKTQLFPTGFRVLCHNCNQSYGAYGYCPHATQQ